MDFLHVHIKRFAIPALALDIINIYLKTTTLREFANSEMNMNSHKQKICICNVQNKEFTPFIKVTLWSLIASGKNIKLLSHFK